MRRHSSVFAHGAPAAGLLLMRVAAGAALLFHGVAASTAGLAPALMAFHIAGAAMGVLLSVGLWTPIVGPLIAIAAALLGFLNPADVGFYVLMSTLAAALTLLGPGAWSVDAHLSGWRRIQIRPVGAARNADGGAKRHQSAVVAGRDPER